MTGSSVVEAASETGPEVKSVESERYLSGDGGDTLVTEGALGGRLEMEEKTKESGLELISGLASGLQTGGGNEAERGSDSAQSAGKHEEGEEGDDKAGIALFVNIRCPLESANESEKVCVNAVEEGFTANGDDAGADEFGKKACLKLEEGENEVNASEEKDNGHVDEHGEIVVDYDNEEMGADEQNGYVVGDFAWCKVGDCPWWPGKILDHEDKNKNNGSQFVALFGKGSLSWCLPFQLKPFAENFEVMFNQNNSEGFTSAVQEALDEFGKCVEFMMTCSCAPERNRIKVSHSFSLNIRKSTGTQMIEGDTDKFVSRLYKPSELLAYLRCLAGVVSNPNLVEVTLLKGWLSAFYTMKGHYPLPLFQESSYIEGLEDRESNGELEADHFNVPVVVVPIQGPHDDWLYSPGRCPDSAQGNINQSRKRKSMAELMKQETPKEENSKRMKTRSSGATLEKKRIDNEKDGICSDNASSSSGRRQHRKKKAGHSMYIELAEDSLLNVENSKNEGEAAACESPSSRKREGSQVSDIETEEGKDVGYISSPRERKRSKYLSPPYTGLEWITNFNRDIKSAKLDKVARMVESIGKCDPSPSPQSEKPDHKSIIDCMKGNASVGEVLSEVQSAAVAPSLKGGILGLFWEFLQTFRSSVYVDGPYYEWYHKCLHDGKDKTILLGAD